MSDKFAGAKRSEIMARVHSTNTAPEIRVRSLLHSMGFRFRLHRSDLPGNPDITLSKYKTVIFVHGCFWHGCPVCRHAKIRPKANSEYWNKKLDRNIQRDKENLAALSSLGWHVMIIWECETKKSCFSELSDRLRRELFSLMID